MRNYQAVSCRRCRRLHHQPLPHSTVGSDSHAADDARRRAFHHADGRSEYDAVIPVEVTVGIGAGIGRNHQAVWRQPSVDGLGAGADAGRGETAIRLGDAEAVGVRTLRFPQAEHPRGRLDRKSRRDIVDARNAGGEKGPGTVERADGRTGDTRVTDPRLGDAGVEPYAGQKTPSDIRAAGNAVATQATGETCHVISEDS